MAEDFEGVDTRYKVGHVLQEYGLSDLHNELPSLWTGGPTEEAMSLRSLAEKINIELIHRELQRTGVNPVEGEAENVYRLLTQSSVSAGVETQLRNKLDRRGIDLDQLESDFVTHQAVYNYLSDVFEISKESDTDQNPIQKHEERINKLQNRTIAVLENSLQELQSSDEIYVGSADVLVNVEVYCQECGNQYSYSELLQNRGCSCR